MKSLSNLLSKRKQKIKTALNDKDVFYIFGKVIREEFGNLGAGNLRADFFKNRTIFVKSSSSVWAGELWNNRSRIVRKINAELGEGEIAGIKIK